MKYHPNKWPEGKYWDELDWDEWTEHTREFYRTEGWRDPGLVFYSRAVALVEYDIRGEAKLRKAIGDEIDSGCSRRHAIESLATELLDQLDEIVEEEPDGWEEEDSKRGSAVNPLGSIERRLREDTRAIGDREFESLEEMNEFLKEHLDSEETSRSPRPKSAADMAQDLIYDAWECESPRERIQMAREALKIDPDCADAYVLLAREGPGSWEEYTARMRKGVEAAERSLGREKMEEWEGQFWGFVETRPYMRARMGLAQGLERQGRTDEAVSHYRDLLRLNPVDNQGARYLLATCLMGAGRMVELEELLQEYAEDDSMEWQYNRALLAFHHEGDSINSRAELKRALETNQHVPPFLLGKKKMPEELPEFVTLGSAEQAAGYSAAALPGWRQTHGALAWLRNVNTRHKKVLQ